MLASCVGGSSVPLSPKSIDPNAKGCNVAFITEKGFTELITTTGQRFLSVKTAQSSQLDRR